MHAKTSKPTEHEIKFWYNDKYQKEGAETMRPFEAYPIFLKYLGVKPGGALLDVSCGTGYLLKAAADLALKTSGIDISDRAVEIARRTSPLSDIRVGAGEELPFPDQCFDYITCLGALEHFLDIDKGLQEMQRVAKPDALFCIMVPNVNYFFAQFRPALGTEQQDINEHLLSLKEWKNILLKHEFDIIKIYDDEWFYQQSRLFTLSSPSRFVKQFLFKFFQSHLK